MKQKNSILLIIILSIAIILRFYNYFEIPYTYDEFSALFRLNFGSFSKLIQEGVIVDTHPAGVQVFLYYWTMLFGCQEWIVKLPFTVFGVLSVYIIYLIGKKWFNETSGLISAAYLASIQFTVIYSQIARPYISGLFFSLLMVYYWSNLIMNPDKGFNRNSILFIITASLCSYNHYFSLLFAAIVGLSGLLFIQRRYLIKYALSGLIIFMLYIPHLWIFFYQLNKGGVEEWLGKPHNDFLIEFVYYIFNYSLVAIFIALLIMLFGLIKLEKKSVNYKLLLLSIAWFIIPFLIGFFYSKFVNGVLQYSVLIFSFPFLYFVMFGFIKKQSATINSIIVSIIILTNVLTLIYSRRQYDFFYKSSYEQILKDYQNIKKNNTTTVYIIDSDKQISDYYIHKLNIDTSFVNYTKSFKNIKEFKNYLEEVKDTTDKLFYACLSSSSQNVIPIIQDYFPNIEIQNNYFGGTSYLFSKQTHKTGKTIDNLSFDTPISKYWSSIDTAKIFSTNGSVSNKGYSITSDVEFGPMFSIPLKDVIYNENNFIDVSVDAKSSESYEGILIVVSLELKKEIIYWGSSAFSDFVSDNADSLTWHKIHHTIKLSDVYLKHGQIMLSVYVWNKDKKNCKIDNFSIFLRDGNPYIYGMFEKI